MGVSSDSIEHAAGKTCQKATKTTLLVNLEAQLAHEELIRLTQDFNEAFRKTMEQLQTVVSEFERTDEELQGTMNELLPFNDLYQNDFMK